MRGRGRVEFRRPLNFIFDVAAVAGTVLVQLHTRLCCVYVCTRDLPGTTVPVVRNVVAAGFMSTADVLLLL